MRKKVIKDRFGIAFSDVLVTVLSVIFMIYMLVAMLPHNEKPPEIKNSLQGDLCVEMSWPNDRDVDLDLWGRSPDSQGAKTVPNGYSNLHGPVLDMFRDVLGFSNNPAHLNIEIMCATVLYPGEWTFNVNYFEDHDFTNKDHTIKVMMVVRIRKDHGRDKLLNRTVTLDQLGQEETMFDFKIDPDGNIEDDSINFLFQPLRSGAKTSRAGSGPGSSSSGVQQ